MASSTRKSPGDRRDPERVNAWILGTGLPSLTAAAHLIREAKVPPSQIHILEKLETPGGGSVSSGDSTNGYDFRAGGMPQFNDVCVEELLSLVPSKHNPGKTALEDILEFNKEHPMKEVSHARFLSHKSYGLSRTEPKKVNLGLRDRVDLFMLTAKTEKSLGRTRIDEYFNETFFKGNYWLMLATTFGFQPWHSAAELRRFITRFMHDIHELNTPRGLDRGPYNRHEAIISPVAQFLVASGVDFHFKTTVSDIVTETIPGTNTNRITELHTVKEDEPEHIIPVKPDDIVIVSLGSVMSGATTGTNITPPSLEFMDIDKDLDENWLLWLELSTKDPRFGNAYNFCTRMSESRLVSFTTTFKTPEFFNRFTQLTGDKPGTGCFVTIKDSRWLLTLRLPAQPLFPDQPDDVQVMWGYALYPNHHGNFVSKSMLNCSGEEIMTEVLHQLQFPVEKILRDSITIPCVVPRATATLLPRQCGDRPPIIPPRMDNIALIGQFVDIPDEPVVSQDYSVRGAQIAVNSLMGLDKCFKKGKKNSAINLMGIM